MADVLIKGLEIPKGDLALWITVHKDGTVEYLDNNKYEGYKTLKNAAVTVPPHGRLIDADDVDTIAVICNERGLLKAIDAPIIIPASKAKNDG